jgi:hypothetical protein
MSKDAPPEPEDAPRADRQPRWSLPAAVLAALVGLGLLADSLWRSSATYDEVRYLQVAARWWRTGDQAEITRMGSPLLFWKLQQAPVLWLLDRVGHRAWVDDPLRYQSELLPRVRLGSLWIWLTALVLTALWSRQLHGPRAMALGAWLFALSPNLLAHGNLATMELPLAAAGTALFYSFWRFLQRGARRDFWTAAVLGGLAWSCKFTTVIIPPILGLVWWVDRYRRGERPVARLTFSVVRAMAAFVAVLLFSNWVLTGFATLPISGRSGDHPELARLFGPALGRRVGGLVETPIPQDMAGFVNQLLRQREGGPSYLLGERRQWGWRHYYLVALAVKVPLTFWLLAAGRWLLRRRIPTAGHAGMLPAVALLFLAIAAAGSTRNYGIRYLLPLAPLAIVWVSGLAEGGRAARVVAAIGLIGQAVAVASVYPHELTYFNVAAGGPIGGRRVLADSNLDWGQGLRSLARLQRTEPAFRDLTLYYFGDTDAAYYGVSGRCYTITAVSPASALPPVLEARTKYLAVSASLQWGPWGPEGYFRALDGIEPVRLTDDRTIAVYRTNDLGALRGQ